MTNLGRYPPVPTVFGGKDEFASSLSQTDSKMNPDSLPRIEAGPSLETPSKEPFDSSDPERIPQASSSYTCVDTGACSARFGRLSTTHIPAWPALQLTCGIPLGCVFQPFAEASSAEVPVQPVQPMASEGPFRCSACQAFVNPNFTWEDEGMKARCNLCLRQRDVPPEYFGIINGFGVRQDRFTRAELHQGSVDFLPPSDIVYSTSAPVMVFVIDVSYLSTSSGFLDAILATLKDHITDLPLETETVFILFDECIHFVKFELTRNGSPSLITMSDVDDPFIPDTSLSVSPHLLADQIKTLLSSMKSLSLRANPNRAISCANAALSVAVDVARTHNPGGGSIAVFQSSSSKVGIGRITDPSSSLGPELFRKCLESNLCVDLFACSDSVVSMGLDFISGLVADLNGDQYMVNQSDLSRKLVQYLRTPKQYNCVMRVRCSKSLNIDSIDFGRRKGVDSISISRMTSESTMGVSFSITETVNHTETLYLQLACLYTRSDGARLIRVHNLMIKPCPQAVKVFKHADMETLGYLMARHALNDHLERPNKCSIKDSVMKQLVAILHAYRVNCAVSSGSGQLILPDSLKALPLYISGFLKQASIRARTASNSCASPGNGDELCVQFRSIQKLNVRHASFAFLTRIVSIYPSVQAEFVAASRNKIYPSRMYLIDLDDHIIFYVGREVDPKLVSLLFGPSVVEKLSDPRKSPVMDVQPRLNENEWTVNVRSLIESLTWGRPPVQYKCILGSSTVGETKLSNMLYEDRIGNESGYIDWLCNIHRIIQEKIDT